MNGDGDDKLHVLIVDDTVFQRMIVERVFTMESFKVSTAVNGMKALEFLGLAEPSGNRVNDFKSPDLIVTDYDMPVMNGFELLKKLKSSALSEIPVVLMSAEPNKVPNRVASCLEEGAHDFIEKPLKATHAKSLKNFVLESKAQRAPDVNP